MIPWIASHILTITIFLPLVGVLPIMMLPRRFEEGSRAIALFFSLITFIASLAMWWLYQINAVDNGFTLIEQHPWIPTLNFQYFVGIDGVSLLMIVLTTLLIPLAILGAWNEIKTRRKEFMGLILLTEVGLLGAFAALDLFLFYVFWELMLIPMYFLVGIWGGKHRIMAAMKLLIYTLFGSLLMLVAIFVVYAKSGYQMNLIDLYQMKLDPGIQLWCFMAFALAFAIKVPLWPVHTWLPDAHTEAPTAGSVILAGVFLKVGAYGFYRIAMPLFPDAVLQAQPLLMSLSVIGIVVGALVAMIQPDMKRLIAYSSVSHMGFVMLGLASLTTEGVEGAVLQLVNHGISTGALFLLIGIIYSRTHTRQISDYGGIAKVVPWFSAAFIFVALSSAGLPGLNNFVGEFLTLMGGFAYGKVYGVIAAIGVILGAAYLLWLVERVFFGQVTNEHNKTLKDLNPRELTLLIPLMLLMVVFGVYPKLLLDPCMGSISTFLQLMGR
ncbi:MAG: Fe-S-binding domain-containing protein [Deltaproteobacteria bacterium CG11_big_fil_rev_8_21_14_0_20_47_16]|nr:MAG: Fe-S-binding domain-containing protein [Deltaproteobacteria bacterium CG11_big_fil_rev_8_21_14_0_20_47_16]